MNLWIGDVSSVLAMVPSLLLDQKYSRDFERESDQYAIDMMQANGVPLTPMVELFEKMARARAQHDAPADEDDEGTEDEENKSAPMEYFSSHPSDAERIAKLRAADLRSKPGRK